MEERLQFVRDALRDRFTMSELCAPYGVSRRVGYKGLARYEAEGRAGLADWRRIPYHWPHKIAPAMEELRVAERIAHPYWGARTRLAVLRRQQPRRQSWPAASTVADLLARRGLVHKRRPRRKLVHPSGVRPVTAGPNHHTRYLLACRGVRSTQTVTAKPIFERAFREYGLPLAIHTDNGVPFATQALLGLSYRNVWWMRLGMRHQRSHPGCRRTTAPMSGCIAP